MDNQAPSSTPASEFCVQTFALSILKNILSHTEKLRSRRKRNNRFLLRGLRFASLELDVRESIVNCVHSIVSCKRMHC